MSASALAFGYLTEIKRYNGLGDFRFQEFEDQVEFDSYIQHKDYGKSHAHPAICFAFGIQEKSHNSYELDL